MLRSVAGFFIRSGGNSRLQTRHYSSPQDQDSFVSFWRNSKSVTAIITAASLIAGGFTYVRQSDRLLKESLANMDSSNEVDQMNLCGKIMIMSSLESGRKQIMENQMVPQLIRNLDLPTTKYQNQAAEAISNMAKHEASLRPVFAEESTLSKLFAMAQSGSSEAVRAIRFVVETENPPQLTDSRKNFIVSTLPTALSTMQFDLLKGLSNLCQLDSNARLVSPSDAENLIRVSEASADPDTRHEVSVILSKTWNVADKSKFCQCEAFKSSAQKHMESKKPKEIQQILHTISDECKWNA
eukprot:TRINITY_DN4832_c0_g1_i1.p1 TRINITY_DN4832_c0_g1~~TRINITY_DN4832_c0_g1_i1.p1  ORF type:complete len:297 (-),score=65.42 TRINITY_DN4832_c0_g1_i1:14-904(-)